MNQESHWKNELKQAQELYSSFWKKTWEGMECWWPTDFQGDINDLKALGYCEYETGHPEDSYNCASLIWANAICLRTPLEFGCDQTGGIVIQISNWPRVCVTPSALIRDIANSSDTQFDLFELATCHIVSRLAEHDYYVTEGVNRELLTYIRDSDVDYVWKLSCKLDAYTRCIRAEE